MAFLFTGYRTGLVLGRFSQAFFKKDHALKFGKVILVGFFVWANFEATSTEGVATLTKGGATLTKGGATLSHAKYQINFNPSLASFLYLL